MGNDSGVAIPGYFISGLFTPSSQGISGWGFSNALPIRHPTSRDSGWYKCPFCGRRQNVKDDGGNCLACKGDVMHESVR